MEIVIKVIKEDEKFLDLTGVPNVLKLRSGLGKYLYRRDCYDDIIKDIIVSSKVLQDDRHSRYCWYREEFTVSGVADVAPR